MGAVYRFSAKVWLYPGDAGWHFVTVPKEVGARIKRRHGPKARGWGSLPVTVTAGKTSWRTSVFPDGRQGTYVLPIKADVRKKERIGAGSAVRFRIEMRT